MQRFLVLGVFVGLLAQAQERAAVNKYSLEKERALGEELASQVRSQSTVIDDAGINAYVAQLGQKLAAALPGSTVRYTFAVVDRNLGGSTSEPLALPGGYIFIPSSLLLAARSESELAGMLAHAMAHVEARHGTRQATRAQTDNLATVPLVFVSSPGAGDASLLPAGLRNAQREFEKEADQIAVAILARTGYDPEALANYIARAQYDAAAASALPPRDERVAAIRAAIQQGPQSDFSNMQNALHRLMPAANAPSLVK